MAVAYFDAFSGISGDMAVGAFLGLGLPLDHLRAQLGQLGLGGYEISASERRIQGIKAVKFDVHCSGEDPRQAHRSLADIREIMQRSRLAAAVKDKALHIFVRLAEAEGRVHGVPADAVTFHEAGAIDSIIDVVGAAVGAEYFAVDRFFVSPLPGGSGVVECRHGVLPVPAPATVELLKGFRLHVGEGTGELVTPTGAAIVAALAETAEPPPLRLAAVGYGAGSRILPDRPNLLRIFLGEVEEELQADHVVVIETNIDDTNPQFYDFVFERLFEAGARDVSMTPVQMKKNRPGTLLRVLCDPADRDRLAAIVLRETSALGVRFFPVRRIKLARETATVVTAYGTVHLKVARGPDGSQTAAPEYDDCARLAREQQIPLKRVYQAALAAYLKR